VKRWPRSIQLRMIVWNSDVLTTAARLCPFLDRSYVTATTEATQVYNYYCSDCPIWSTTERSNFLFRTSLSSVVGCSLASLYIYNQGIKTCVLVRPTFMCSKLVSHDNIRKMAFKCLVRYKRFYQQGYCTHKNERDS